MGRLARARRHCIGSSLERLPALQKILGLKTVEIPVSQTYGGAQGLRRTDRLAGREVHLPQPVPRPLCILVVGVPRSQILPRSGRSLDISGAIAVEPRLEARLRRTFIVGIAVGQVDEEIRGLREGRDVAKMLDHVPGRLRHLLRFGIAVHPLLVGLQRRIETALVDQDHRLAKPRIRHVGIAGVGVNQHVELVERLGKVAGLEEGEAGIVMRFATVIRISENDPVESLDGRTIGFCIVIDQSPQHVVDGFARVHQLHERVVGLILGRVGRNQILHTGIGVGRFPESKRRGSSLVHDPGAVFGDPCNRQDLIVGGHRTFVIPAGGTGYGDLFEQPDLAAGGLSVRQRGRIGCGRSHIISGIPEGVAQPLVSIGSKQWLSLDHGRVMLRCSQRLIGTVQRVAKEHVGLHRRGRQGVRGKTRGCQIAEEAIQQRHSVRIGTGSDVGLSKSQGRVRDLIFGGRRIG